MDKMQVGTALAKVGEARRQWGQAQARFNAETEALMGRLLNEAAANKMSVEAVAEATGMTPTKTRALMRRHGLNPKTGRNLLAKQAAQTLAENAALLGVEPREFDLLSPLAYLPMGRELRGFLETNRMTGDDIESLADEHGDAEQLAGKLTDAGLDYTEAVQWVNDVIRCGTAIKTPATA